MVYIHNFPPTSRPITPLQVFIEHRASPVLHSKFLLAVYFTYANVYISVLLFQFVPLSPGEGNGNPLQNSCLKNSLDRGVGQTTVHGVTKSQT